MILTFKKGLLRVIFITFKKTLFDGQMVKNDDYDHEMLLVVGIKIWNVDVNHDQRLEKISVGIANSHSW